MNDEQCQHLLDAIKLLCNAVSNGAEQITEAIEGIYCADNGGIEKRLEVLIDTLLDIEERRSFHATE